MDFYYPDFSAADAWKNKANNLEVNLEAVKKVNHALTEILLQIAPDHPLAKRENRLKVADGADYTTLK